jgi:hypothetical protein
VEVNKIFYNGGNHRSVVSVYKRFGEVVVILDFWSEKLDDVESELALNKLLESFEGSKEIFALQDFDGSSENLIVEDNFFHIEIPIYWERKEKINNVSAIKTFSSPDKKIIFQTIVYDDGEKISKSAAADFVLKILNENYAKLTMIESDRVCVDGREEITWYSYYSNYDGITYFEVSDNSLVMFTAIYERDLEDHYRLLLDRVISTHNINQINPCEG